MAMPIYQRAVAEIVVDVFVAIHIVNAAALAVFHGDWIGRVITIVAGYSEWHSFRRFLMRFTRSRSTAFVVLQLFLQCVVHLECFLWKSSSLYSFAAISSSLSIATPRSCIRRTALGRTGSAVDRARAERGRSPHRR